MFVPRPSAILFFLLICKIITPAIGVVVSVYWAFHYDVLTRVYQQGLETGIAVFFVLLLVYKLYEFETTWRNKPVSNKQLFADCVQIVCLEQTVALATTEFHVWESAAEDVVFTAVVGGSL